jgi:UDP-N-acetylmuramoylalanine--D-glutamate ligase
MTPASTFRGKRVALFGLGGSGLATARALAAGGAKVQVDDDQGSAKEKAKAEGLIVADLRKEDWAAFDALVLAPGIPLTHPKPHWSVDRAHAAGVTVIGDMEIFARERRAHAPAAPFVAITGTNGKSTTTALIAHILRENGRAVALGGNIGTPVLALDAPRPALIHVLECSSYQIELAPSLAPTVGVHLNLSEDHLDRHGTMQRYAAVKQSLVDASGMTVVGVDDGLSAAIADRRERAGGSVVRISARRALAHGVYAEGAALFEAANGAARRAADLAGVPSLRGRHNAQNAAAAFAAVRVFGLEAGSIARALRTFPGLPHRMEEVGRSGRVLFVNDSKATNADATARALSSFDAIYWIAGGRPKTGGILPLKDFFTRIRKAYLIGEAAEEFARTLGAAVPHLIAGDLATALDHAAEDAAASSDVEPVVLLSPACASFDQFRSFEHRGDAFRQLVHDLLGGSP